MPGHWREPHLRWHGQRIYTSGQFRVANQLLLWFQNVWGIKWTQRKPTWCILTALLQGSPTFSWASSLSALWLLSRSWRTRSISARTRPNAASCSWAARWRSSSRSRPSSDSCCFLWLWAARSSSLKVCTWDSSSLMVWNRTEGYQMTMSTKIKTEETEHELLHFIRVRQCIVSWVAQAPRNHFFTQKVGNEKCKTGGALVLGLAKKRKTETTPSDLTASRVQHQKRAFHKGQWFDLMSKISANQRSVTHSWGAGVGWGTAAISHFRKLKKHRDWLLCHVYGHTWENKVCRWLKKRKRSEQRH